jgi:hypothetical protein
MTFHSGSWVHLCAVIDDKIVSQPCMVARITGDTMEVKSMINPMTSFLLNADGTKGEPGKPGYVWLEGEDD